MAVVILTGNDGRAGGEIRAPIADPFPAVCPRLRSLRPASVAVGGSRIDRSDPVGRMGRPRGGRESETHERALLASRQAGADRGAAGARELPSTCQHARLGDSRRRFGTCAGERAVFCPAHGQTSDERRGAVARRRWASSRMCSQTGRANNASVARGHERLTAKRARRTASGRRKRVFHMLVRDGDVYSPSNYIAVPAVLRGVGRRIQVYVAGRISTRWQTVTVADIVNTFDDRIFPLMSSRFGPAPDVDGDGRFTVLLSSWLDHLGGGRYAVDGFVRVADLDRVVRPPLGNQCDMMYLSTRARERAISSHGAGARVHARGSLRPEGSWRQGQGAGLVQEEEGWLDEAIAHLAEDCCGFSTSNIDYRVSAFLAWPERYQLVVDDYYAADLFRSHGNRGSTYLFLRWCADRYGRGLASGSGSLAAARGGEPGGMHRRDVSPGFTVAGR